MQLILEELGQNVITALSGREALRRLLDQDFAVILLDVNMPDMDGFETAALIRKRKRSEHIPIIFVTAFGDEILAARGYSLGAVDYILSPVIPEILRTKVQVFVELFQKNEQVKRQAEEHIALARAQAARAAAEEASRRSSFLAEASRALVRSLDYEATLRAMACLPVPFLADLSAVTTPDEHGEAWRTELAWHNPDKNACDQVNVPEKDLPHYLVEAIQRVLTSGKSESLGETVAWPLKDQPSAPAAEAAKPRTLLLPLYARGRTLGVLSLARQNPDRPFNPADAELAGDLAGRTAIAIDNARLYRDIQEADRRKTEFLAMLAHELRNPLAPIRNAVQLLRYQGGNDPQLEWARDIIDRQVQQMARLVDDLLDVSRITRGKINLQMEPIDAAAVVSRAVETSRPLIDARHHELTVSVLPEPLMVQADSTRLAQVLSNLLNNAAKYTEDGGHVWLTVAREGDEAVFRVRDSGMGIPPELLSSVFDLFIQADRSLDRSQGGLGIGLTLVRRLVELHGGTVKAFSAGPGKGSEFVVRLPVLKNVPAPERSVKSVSPPQKNGRSRRILVVDDNVDATESLALLLRLTGHEVSIAHDGQAALQLATTFRPSVVLLDLGLPGMSGYEVAQQMRRLPALTDTVLVALTGYGQDEDRQRSRAAGFDHHLVKPIDPESLPRLLDSLSRQRQPV
jgi:signal transduction histidine kinase/CheY-like chemotaxis protein